MTHDRDHKLESLGYPLDRIPPAAAIYQPVIIDGSTLYTSGNLPMDGEQLLSIGRVGSAVSMADAKKAAALCAANILRNVRKRLGSLDGIECVLKTTGFVNSEPGFSEQHLVLNGASELLRDVLGEPGVGVRSAVGVAALPLNASVEVEVIFRIKV